MKSLKLYIQLPTLLFLMQSFFSTSCNQDHLVNEIFLEEPFLDSESTHTIDTETLPDTETENDSEFSTNGDTETEEDPLGEDTSSPPNSCEFGDRYHIHQGIGVPYRLYIPTAYDEANSYPLFIGIGAKDHEKPLCSDDVQIQNPHFIITLWPNSDGPEFISQEYQTAVIDMLDYFGSLYNINEDMIYLSGSSTWGHYAYQMINFHPNTFAAAVTISAPLYAYPTDDIDRIKTVSLWNFHGDEDPYVPMAQSLPRIRKMERETGRPLLFVNHVSPDTAMETINNGVDLVHQTIENGAHNIWPTAYKNTLMHQWLFQQIRIDPNEVQFVGFDGPQTLSGITPIRWNTELPSSYKVDLLHSPHQGAQFTPIALNLPNSGYYSLNTLQISNHGTNGRFRINIKNNENNLVGVDITDGRFAINNGENTNEPWIYLMYKNWQQDFPPPFERYYVGITYGADQETQVHISYLISTDGGATFQRLHEIETIAVPEPTRNSEYEIDLTTLPSSSNTILSVELTDGIHTVQDHWPAFDNRN